MLGRFGIAVSVGIWDLLVVELKADPKNRVRNPIIPLAYIEQGLAKVSAQVQVVSNIVGFCGVVSAVVETFAKFPAAFPGFFVGIGCSRAVENSHSVYGTQVGERIAQRPAFFQCRPERLQLRIILSQGRRKLIVVVVLILLGF